MTLAEYIARWQLTPDGAPIETMSSMLQPVVRDGVPAMLKVVRAHSDEHDQAQILIHWGTPAVRVLEHDRDALLMERLAPGTALTDVTDDDEATRIWCGIVAALHQRPAPHWPHSVEAAGESFERPWPTHARLPHELIAHAHREYTTLCATEAKPRVLLHADLHHGNILRAADGWRVIDPKGVCGELAYEAGAWLRNPSLAACEPAVVERRVRLITAQLDLDGERVLRWCFAQGVLSALWCLEDSGEDAILDDSLFVAESARGILNR
jgi:streptomycin 6-kinase